jgi:hypothetical protein
MNSRNLGFAGAALLAGGLFTPIMTVPILGSVNLFNNGTNLVGIDLLILAILAGVLAAKERTRALKLPGIAACGIVLYEFASLQWRLAEMRESLERDLQGNPFAGLAQGAANAIQLQWGWLVLAAGAGVIAYAGLSSPRVSDAPAINLRDNVSRAVAGVSFLLLLFVPAWDVLSQSHGSSPTTGASAAPATADGRTSAAGGTPTAGTPSVEEAAYIKSNLKLYDLKAKYYDSMLDGRVPGVEFKLQNNGNRTLNKVTVRVVFYDAAGNPISEQDYDPVLVSSYSADDSTPLRPHYIWQQESDKFYEAKTVPSEWAEGKVTASVTAIEFGPNG